MKNHFLLCLFLFIDISVQAQQQDIWRSFPNKDTTLIGFKDKNGKVKIEPKFTGFTTANKFENIIAVSEEENGKWKSYYLTKSGKVVGRDSLYVFDNSPDCENEGFIRFRDPKTDEMGIFNSEGTIVIPAEYSVLSNVQNGMIKVLKDAKKEREPGDEHFFWTGGKELVIDVNNKILIENFKDSRFINLYSLEKTKEPHKDQIRDNFLGVDGLYYSFINYEREFAYWLKNTLLTHLSKTNFEKHSFDKITYWAENGEWISEPKAKFIHQNFNILKIKLQQLNSKKTDYFISSGGLNQFIYESEEYDIYFNNCHESKDWMYPTMDIIINQKNKTDFEQDHFEFLRTENGYKLISVSLKKEILK